MKRIRRLLTRSHGGADPPLAERSTVARGPKTEDRRQEQDGMRPLRHLHLPGHCYFVTCRCWPGRPRLGRDSCKQIVLDVLALYRNRGLYALHGFVVMPDHLHLVLTPSDSANISRIMHNVKVAASKRLRAWMHLPPPNWQRGFHDHIVRSGDAYIEIMNYVHQNPVRRGLAARPGDYRWSSWANYHRPEEAKIDIDPMLP